MGRNSHRDNLRRANQIRDFGDLADKPCLQCSKDNSPCIMDKSRSTKCEACLRKGRNCSHRERTDKEHDSYLRTVRKKKADLAKAQELSSLALAEAQRKAQEYSASLAKIARLEKELSSLNSKGFEFLSAESSTIPGSPARSVVSPETIGSSVNPGSVQEVPDLPDFTSFLEEYPEFVQTPLS
jgi:hypothetical protein